MDRARTPSSPGRQSSFGLPVLGFRCSELLPLGSGTFPGTSRALAQLLFETAFSRCFPNPPLYLDAPSIHRVSGWLQTPN